MRRLAALLAPAAALALSACGLHPLYAGGNAGPVARTLADVDIAPIGGRAGWLVRTALTDRFHAAAGGAAQYRLEVELDDKVEGFGVRRDNVVTRERRTLRARYRLVLAGNGTVVLDAAASADAGIDVVSSGYATIAAEQTALERLSEGIADQITTRVALFASRSRGTATGR